MSRAYGNPTNHRVVVEPRRLGDWGSIRMSDALAVPGGPEVIAARYKERCDEIAADIKRHVDNAGYIEVIFDREEVCEHCGREWTESSKTYNGGCCAADEDAEVARQAAATGAAP